jgi:hypothetical protein
LSKLSIIALLPIAFSACGEAEEVKDDQFCKCLDATAKMDAESSKLMEGDIDVADAQKVKKLADAMKKECKNYTEISQEEGLKLKALCEKK